VWFPVFCDLCHSQTYSTLSLPLHEGISSPLLLGCPLPAPCCWQEQGVGAGAVAGAVTGTSAGATVSAAQLWLHLAALEMCWVVVRSSVATKVLRTGWNADEGQKADDGANTPSSVAYPGCPGLAHSLLSGRVTGSCLGQCTKQCQTARTHAVLSGDRQQ